MDNRTQFAKANATESTNPELAKFCKLLGRDEGTKQFRSGISFEAAQSKEIDVLKAALESTATFGREKLHAADRKIEQLTRARNEANQTVERLTRQLQAANQRPNFTSEPKPRSTSRALVSRL